MSRSQRLRIDLDRPMSGWLKVELSSGDQNYSFFPSHVSYDAISELVDALLKILDGNDKAVVRWDDEPVEHEFVFEPKGDQVAFRVYLINETIVGKAREQVFTFSGHARRWCGGSGRLYEIWNQNEVTKNMRSNGGSHFQRGRWLNSQGESKN